MPRKGPAPKRPLVVDPVYGSPIVTQPVNRVLRDGKQSVAQAIVYLACAPKSNAVYMGFKAAMRDAAEHGSLEVPLHLRNAPTKLMKELGYHDGYRYDHDYPDAFAGQQFFPEELAGDKRAELYAPNERGFEREVKKRLDYWARLRAERPGNGK